MMTIDRAYALLNAGRGGEAVAALEAAGRGGDAGALVELGLWALQGLGGPRDLVRCRAQFAAAAALGDRQARMVHLSFVAQGLGRPADWTRGIALLRALAREDASAAVELELIERMRVDEQGRPLALPAARVLSASPQVALFPGLFTADEAAALMRAAGPALVPSVVIDPRTGRALPHPVRTSDNASFPYVDETPLIHALNLRLAAASGTAVNAGEPLTVLRYRAGQEYRPHHDALPGTDNQRMLTMIAYLNAGYGGGATVFLSNGLRVAGGVGDVLMFRNADGAGRPDPKAQHAGEAVTSGEKFIATRWIRERAFGPR